MSNSAQTSWMLVLKAVSALIFIATLIVSVALAVSDRPVRAEVRQMIDDRVSYRLDQIDKRLENIEHTMERK